MRVSAVNQVKSSHSMVTRIDLSAMELAPATVVRFIEGHSADRPTQDTFFKVSKPTFKLFQKKRPKDAVRISTAEAEELSQFLHEPQRPEDYAVWKPCECTNCARIFTFYELFQTGRKLHGDELVASYLIRNDQYHVHIHKGGRGLPVNCTSCGAQNNLKCGYDGPEYCCPR